MSFFDIFRNKKDDKGQERSVRSIDLDDLKFVSNQHARYQNGQLTGTTDDTTYRGIRIRRHDGSGHLYTVSIHMVDGVHPIWNDNVTMAPKTMHVVSKTPDVIVLRGVAGHDVFSDFSDYGMTLHLDGDQVDKIVLHMHDRATDIHYLSGE